MKVTEDNCYKASNSMGNDVTNEYSFRDTILSNFIESINIVFKQIFCTISLNKVYYLKHSNVVRLSSGTFFIIE